jgi:hypothetical protein
MLEQKCSSPWLQNGNWKRIWSKELESTFQLMQGFQSTEQTSGRFVTQEWKAAGFCGVWMYTQDVARFAGSAKYWWENTHEQPRQQSENGSTMITGIPECILVVLALQLLLNTILQLGTYPSSDSSSLSEIWQGALTLRINLWNWRAKEKCNQIRPLPMRIPD